MRNTMQVACAIGADAVVFHVGSHLGSGFEHGLERVLPAMEQVLELCTDETWLLMENSAGTGGTIGRSIDELATIYERLDRHPRLGMCLDSCHLYASGVDVTDVTQLDALLDEVDVLDRARPPAGAARQRLRCATRLEPRPPREHRRRAARRGARGLPRPPAPAGPAGGARDGGAGEERPGCKRGAKGEGDTRTRYRWVILGAGTFAQATFSAVSVGLPALAPALRSHYGLSLGETGVVSGAVGIGMLLTLLAVGPPRRPAERASRDRRSASRPQALALALARRTHSYGALVAALFVAGATGASVNAASGRAVMGWFPLRERGLALGRAADGDPDRRRRCGGGAALARAPQEGHGWRSSCSGASASPAPSSQHRSSASHRRTNLDLEDVVQPMRDPRTWLLGLGAGCFLTAQIAITGFVVLFLHVHRGVSTHAAAALLAGINILGIGARIASGRWSDRIQARLASDPVDRRLARRRNGCSRGARRRAARGARPRARDRRRSARWPGTASRSLRLRKLPAAAGSVRRIGFQQTLLGLIRCRRATCVRSRRHRLMASRVRTVRDRAAGRRRSRCGAVPEATEAARRREMSAIPPAAR